MIKSTEQMANEFVRALDLLHTKVYGPEYVKNLVRRGLADHYLSRARNPDDDEVFPHTRKNSMEIYREANTVPWGNCRDCGQSPEQCICPIPEDLP